MKKHDQTDLNKPCPCGSGKKYKQCCLKRDQALAAGSHSQAASIHQTIQVAMEHHQAGRLPQAEALYQQILQVAPHHPDALHLLGVIAHQTDRNEIAIELIGKSLLVNPDSAEAHNNLGLALQAQDKLEEAVANYHKALSIKTDYAEAHNNLGNALKGQGKLGEAAENLRQALSLKPNFAEAHNNLGNVLFAQDQFEAASKCFRQALSLKPSYAEAHYNLGNALQKQYMLDEAVRCFQKALELRPNYAKAHYNIGFALHDQGKLDEAIEHYRKALSIQPINTEAQSNLLFVLNFLHDMSKEEIFLAAQKYDAQNCLPLRPIWPVHRNDKNPNRRLRVGYVSPDFRNHAVASFAEPILANHDKSQIEIFCYAEVKQEDEVTERFRQLADHWHSTVGMSNEAAVKMIVDHRIDILVDLAGHTANNRLLVFARKPAPLQLTYLGYPGTTGLSAMNYRITDRYADPDGISDVYYAECLLRLPNSLWCYRPSADMPEPSVLPALARGYLTFGSFNNFNKVDLPTLDLWGELLRALPTSRLMMLTVPEGDTRQRLVNRFAELGITAERLEFHGKLPGAEFYRKFLEVDLTLDPVTVNGATTTCESLWMGVPVISLVGTRFLTRAGLSILSTAGLTDFATTSRENYIHLAAHLADNLPLLAEIRAGLRAHVATSPLIDEAGFTRNLEKLYRDIWAKWRGAT